MRENELTGERFLTALTIGCENIRFSSLFAAGDAPSGEERGETDVFAGSADNSVKISKLIQITPLQKLINNSHRKKQKKLMLNEYLHI